MMSCRSDQHRLFAADTQYLDFVGADSFCVFLARRGRAAISAAGLLRIALSHSTLDKSITYQQFCIPPEGGNPQAHAQEAPLTLQLGEPLRLRIFLDRSIIEVFANGRQCMTQRLYPSRADSTGVALISLGGSVNVVKLKAWDMAPTNPA